MDFTSGHNADSGGPSRAILNDIGQQRAGAESRLASQAAYLQCLGGFIATLDAQDESRSDVSPPMVSFSDILHRSFIVTLNMVLEGELKNFTALLARHHPAPREVGFTGSVLDKFKKRVVKRYKLDLPLDKALWRDLRGLYQLRTTLIHDDGRLEGLSAPKRALLEAFAADNGSPAIVDDRVAIDRTTCEQSLALVTRFVAEIYDAAERYFMPGR